MSLTVITGGPGLTIQDLGRDAALALGLSRGGAMDRLAVFEGAALLGQSPDHAVLEMAGMGGTFQVDAPCRVALTGAPMRSSLDGQPLAWNASHKLEAGSVLTIGPALRGSYGYLHLGGGVLAPTVLGGRATHLASGIGAALGPGDRLMPDADAGTQTGMTQPVDDRFSGGTLRLLPTAQTADFPPDLRARLAATEFSRDPRSNRMASRLAHEGAGFALAGALSVLSEITQPGDIQITGDGTPVILMAEAQTTGGYPRIGTVLPADLPKAAQCPPGAPLRFSWITVEDGVDAERRAARSRAALPKAVRPLVRDPHDIRDLLSYTLVGGVVSGKEEI